MSWTGDAGEIGPKGSGTAVLVGDLQWGITDTFPFAETVVEPATRAVVRAREAGALVVYVRTALRPSGADVSGGNTLFVGFHSMGDLFHEGSASTQLDSRLDVRPDDPVVVKRRTSAFAATDLDLVLRANQVARLAFCGVATSAMIAASLYDASDRDYAVTVLSDACADADDDVHHFLVDKVFPSRGASVSVVDAWQA